MSNYELITIEQAIEHYGHLLSEQEINHLKKLIPDHMSFDDYKGKTATIKSTGKVCTIDYVIHKRGAENKLGARFILIDENGKRHELMPHEVNVEL